MEHGEQTNSHGGRRRGRGRAGDRGRGDRAKPRGERKPDNRQAQRTRHPACSGARCRDERGTRATRVNKKSGARDRKSVVEGKRVSVRLHLVGRRTTKKKRIEYHKEKIHIQEST